MEPISESLENPSPPGCANCGTPLRGRYCHACGQEDADPTRQRALDLVREALGDVFAFDSRLVRTLVPLLIRPGFLTREYLAGHRVRFVPPLRLFFFTAVLFFLVMGLTQGRLAFTVQSSSYGEEVLAPSSEESRGVRFGVFLEPGEGGSSAVPSGGDAAEAVFGAESTGTEEPSWPRGLGQRLSELGVDEVNRRLIAGMPQAMFLVAPLHACMLWLVYRRSSRFLMPHLVFSFHVHAFAFVVRSIASPLDRLIGFGDNGPFELLSVLVIPVYYFLAQRRVYQRGRWFTTMATVVTGLLWLIALVVVMVLLTVLVLAL
jgi:hypothetical protein